MISIILNRLIWLGGAAVGRIGMIPGLSSVLGALLPMLAVGVTVWVLLTFQHWGEVSRVRSEERGFCERRIDERLDEFARELNKSADERIRKAREGAAEVVDAGTPADILAACKTDPNCREYSK